MLVSGSTTALTIQ
jgi:hypothetical protein